MTSPAEIERAAFRPFAKHGFEGTTLQAIAEEIGVGRRTLFRNYESKNDISWGQFGQTLQRFRKILGAPGTGRRTPREPWRAASLGAVASITLAQFRAPLGSLSLSAGTETDSSQPHVNAGREPDDVDHAKCRG